MGIARAVGVALAFVVASCQLDGRQRRDPDWALARAAMIRDQLRGRDIVNPRVLDAMSRVPRHLFVPAAVRADAYGDFPLPIGDGQTISQPYIVGFMSQALEVEAHHRVLEIGTGSGYQAAILAELAREVYTIEIVATLSDRARKTIDDLGYKNVHIKTGNGYLGWPEYAPYDRVMVTAAPDAVPSPLVEQLRIGGLMAIPVGTAEQELRILRRTARGLETLRTLPVMFVPMVGKPK